MSRHLPGGDVVVCVTVAMVTRDVILRDVTPVLGTAREIPLCPSLKHIHVNKNRLTCVHERVSGGNLQTNTEHKGLNLVIHCFVSR
jgi:hypothetical protein